MPPENLGGSPSEVSCCPEGVEITHRDNDPCRKGVQDNTITKHVTLFFNALFCSSRI